MMYNVHLVSVRVPLSILNKSVGKENQHCFIQYDYTTLTHNDFERFTILIHLYFCVE